jgi:histidinol-phosphate aminotransferase
MEMVRRLAPPFSVNGIALACLPEALADSEHVASCVASVKRERARLAAELTRHGIPHWPSSGNFILADLREKHTAFTRALEKEGIYVRDRGADPACKGCVRITVGTTAEMDRLFAALPGALHSIAWHHSP